MRVRLLFKVIVTAAILAFVFSNLDIGRTAQLLRRTRLDWLLIAFVSSSLMLVFSAMKWDRLLRRVDIHRSIWTLLRVYTIGFFANSFLPGVIGGDVVRWQLLGNQRDLRTRVAATILIERATGLVAMVLLSAMVVLVAGRQFRTVPVVILVSGLSAAVVVGFAITRDNPLTRRFLSAGRRTRLRFIFERLDNLHQALNSYDRRDVIVAVGYSIVFYLSGGLSFLLICIASAASLSIFQAVAVQSLVSLLNTIPVSVGGLGLTQAGDVYLLGQIDISAERALAISLLRQLVTYGYVLIGGLLFMRWKSTST